MSSKCYNLTVTGKVQDIGLRGVIEYAGRLLDLSGLVFNTRNGGVGIICRGEDSDIKDFSKEIITRGEKRGAIFQDITRQELPFDVDLPYPFSRVLSDEDIDLGRKLDKGNELLTYIKRDTSILPDIKAGIDNLNVKFDTLIAKFDIHNMKFDSFIHGQEEHNLLLEKILEKLAEK